MARPIPVQTPPTFPQIGKAKALKVSRLDRWCTGPHGDLRAVPNRVWVGNRWVKEKQS
jgi:hypothetical protein